MPRGFHLCFRMHSSGMGGDFMPSFMQKGSNGRQVGMSRSGKGGRTPAVKKIIPSNYEAKAELKKSDNAWVRSSEVSKDIPPEESEKEVRISIYFEFNTQSQDSERGQVFEIIYKGISLSCIIYLSFIY